jgi:uncharacterized protein (TIRG00374 family)
MEAEASSKLAIETKPKRHWLWLCVSYGIGAACLYWVFHDVRFSELVRSIAAIQWWWLAPAVVLDLLVYVCAAWEWQILLRPIGRISLGKTAQAMFAGRFANDLLPVHAGYVIRLYLVARWLGRRIAEVVPSLLVERFFDTLWLALAIGLTSFFFPLPQNLARTGEIMGGLIVFGVAVIAWLILRHRKPRPDHDLHDGPRWKLLRKTRSFFHTLAVGVGSIGRSWLIAAGLGFSVIKLILQALAFLSILAAYDFDFAVWVRLAIFLITYIGISMPSTPASVGVFQLFCAAGLTFFGVPKAEASGFALLAFVVLTAPLALAGFFAVAHSGLTLRQIRQEIADWTRERKAGPM